MGKVISSNERERGKILNSNPHLMAVNQKLTFKFKKIFNFL